MKDNINKTKFSTKIIVILRKKISLYSLNFLLVCPIRITRTIISHIFALSPHSSLHSCLSNTIVSSQWSFLVHPSGRESRSRRSAVFGISRSAARMCPALVFWFLRWWFPKTSSGGFHRRSPVHTSTAGLPFRFQGNHPREDLRSVVSTDLSSAGACCCWPFSSASRMSAYGDRNVFYEINQLMFYRKW